MINNKFIGNSFEKEMIMNFHKKGYWVREMHPDKSGRQPFDVLAIKKDSIYAFDCKTETNKIFRFSRIEENQKHGLLFFKKINPNAKIGFFIKNMDQIYWLPFEKIDFSKKGVKIDECLRWN